MKLVAGADGGGTGTRALVLDGEGVERGRGEGPPGLVTRKDLRAAAKEVADAIEKSVLEAMESAGGALRSGARPLARLCAGVAGAGTAEAREAVRAALQDRRLAESVTVTTDVDVALRDAFPAGEPGILLVSGTGSMAAGRSVDGEGVRAGGWGALLDDAGSGYRIGLEGLRAILRSHDGRAPATALTEPLFHALDVSGPEDLVTEVDGASKARVAAIAPLVVEAGRAGDTVARRIVDEAVRELVALVEAVAASLPSAPGGESASQKRSPYPVVLHGGLVAPGRPLREPLREALGAARFRLVDRLVVPARGAARMALEAKDSR